MSANPRISILIALLLAGCASIGRKHMAEPVREGALDDSGGADTTLRISMDLRTDLSSEYFGYFDFNFKNPSDQWMKLTDVKLTFPDSSQNRLIGVVLGNELIAWQKAQKKSREITDYNKQLALGLVGGVGFGLAGSSDNRTVQELGAAAAVGSLTVLGIDEMNKILDDLQSAKMIPENHLLSDTLLIPPGLFADKWILLNSRDHEHLEYVTTLFIEYRIAGGRLEKQKMTFRKKNASGLRPKWQGTIFRRNKQAGTPNPSFY